MALAFGLSACGGTTPPADRAALPIPPERLRPTPSPTPSPSPGPRADPLNPPCDATYGSLDARRAIDQAMRNGTAAAVQAAIDAAKNLRGLRLGCAELDAGPYRPADRRPIQLADVQSAWDRLYRSGIADYQATCPEIGRGAPRFGLAALIAGKAGRFDDRRSLREMAEALVDTQYSAERAPLPLSAPAGIFGYPNYRLLNRCRLSGVAGRGVAQLCREQPSLCPEYTTGRWAGTAFGVNDEFVVDGEPQGDPGGAGFDMGWAGVFLLEAAAVETDPVLQARLRSSAHLAGEWALAKQPVTNHNYTAKLIWLLARLYAEDGDLRWREGMLDKLERNLLPGILLDRDGDGHVDGTDPAIAFADLTPVAQRPGRMWDGHNAVTYYHAMNAWALVEAYAALRDAGDAELAARYRSPALAMMDSLAAEILLLGTPDIADSGWVDTPFALLLAIWKIAQVESLDRPDWDAALAALWNSGAFERSDARAVNVALLLLVLGGPAFVAPR